MKLYIKNPNNIIIEKKNKWKGNKMKIGCIHKRAKIKQLYFMFQLFDPIKEN